MFVVVLTGLARADGESPNRDTLMDAMVGELGRSMKELVLEDLPRPYFIQYNAEDRRALTMRAAYGGLLYRHEDRLRTVISRVRVGSYPLDNTNFGRGSGGTASLPLDDDYTALRHTIWRMTDADYKRAVEAFTRKQAFLRQKNVEDRPDDYTKADPVEAAEPVARLDVHPEQWEENVKKLSARFERYPEIQNADVTFFGGSVNHWIVNAEGTRLRRADTGIYIDVRAEIQADEGMRLADSRQYLGLQIDELPPLAKMLTDVDTLCEKLIALSEAPVIEYYTGPVLFEPIAAGKVFESLLADGLCARPVPLGSRGWGDDSLEKKIGLRILPRSFQVYDDPGPQWFEGTVLAGAYTYDDEAVAPERVTLVENGMLETLLASRAPTRKIKRTTGHGRSGGYSDARAHIGCLYLADDNGLSAEQLKERLIEAAVDEGLAFGLRIESMDAGGAGTLGDPIHAYKVYVDDGREELIRGMEFAPVETRILKRILAAGKQRKVYNATAGIPSSIIAPAILLEELELHKIEREFDKLPILKSPAQRGD